MLKITLLVRVRAWIFICQVPQSIISSMAEHHPSGLEQHPCASLMGLRRRPWIKIVNLRSSLFLYI